MLIPFKLFNFLITWRLTFINSLTAAKYRVIAYYFGSTSCTIATLAELKESEPLLIEKYHVKTAFDLSPSITISSISAGTLSSIVSKSLFLLYI